jgi:hypothetical protein
MAIMLAAFAIEYLCCDISDIRSDVSKKCRICDTEIVRNKFSSERFIYHLLSSLRHKCSNPHRNAFLLSLWGMKEKMLGVCITRKLSGENLEF